MMDFIGITGLSDFRLLLQCSKIPIQRLDFTILALNNDKYRSGYALKI
jgi:hypothetical protein